MNWNVTQYKRLCCNCKYQRKHTTPVQRVRTWGCSS